MNGCFRDRAEFWDVADRVAQDRKRFCLCNLCKDSEVTDAEGVTLSSELCEKV